jgi:hypothetical protein
MEEDNLECIAIAEKQQPYGNQGLDTPANGQLLSNV